MQVQGATLPSSLVELRFLGGHAHAWENVYPCGPQDWTDRAPQRITEPPEVPIAEVEGAVDSAGEERGRGQLCACTSRLWIRMGTVAGCPAVPGTDVSVGKGCLETPLGKLGIGEPSLSSK